ncbi:hypothetical protein [Stakelama saccharophila]|uniref:Transposase n=1 Tax=Stakelama saccharophila TaxID=3075605 RepID=A0ABZ0BBJ7_9SPHN|nr:hypothetical protein [Stakelama sp. W311]WNO54572.1 hypothetical protein RPR59_04775 [Stakelama sp. W311]
MVRFVAGTKHIIARFPFRLWKGVTSMVQVRQKTIPGRSGYRVSYRMNEVNHCPGCGNTQWEVGRMTAECSFCHAAVPINEGGMTGVGLIRTTRPAEKAPLAA